MSYNHGTIYYIYGARSLDRNLLRHLAQYKVWPEMDRQFITYNISIMEGFALVMCIGAVIGTSLAIWSYTKSGQKWIDEL